MVIDHEFPPDIRVENEIEALLEAKYEIHVACFTRKSRKSMDNFLGAIIHRKTISKFVYKTSVGALKFPFYFNFWKKYLTELFEKYQFDAIHIHDLPLASVGKIFAKRYGIKFVLDLHENWPSLLEVSQHTKTFIGKIISNQKQWKKYEIESCINADNIITVVEEAKDRLINLGIDKNKISIVSNTINFNHFKIIESEPDKNYYTALYSGGINKHRGLQYVIKGIKYLNELQKPFRLWIIGDGSYLPDLKQLAKKEGVFDQVQFFGWKPFDEMQTYFGKADFFLIPHNKSEHTDTTIPHKIFQYMYSNRPVIASNCAPIERILTKTNSGMIYKFNNPKYFAQKVIELLHFKQIELFGKNGQKAVIEKYNWINDSKILQQIYK